MSARCQIHLEQVKDTIIVPHIAVFDEDSIKVVYVKKNKFYEMRQVVITHSSLQTAVVSAGLAAQEQIALLRPPRSHIKSKKFLPDSIISLFAVNPSDSLINLSPELSNE